MSSFCIVLFVLYHNLFNRILNIADFPGNWFLLSLIYGGRTPNPPRGLLVECGECDFRMRGKLFNVGYLKTTGPTPVMLSLDLTSTRPPHKGEGFGGVLILTLVDNPLFNLTPCPSPRGDGSINSLKDGKVGGVRPLLHRLSFGEGCINYLRNETVSGVRPRFSTVV